MEDAKFKFHKNQGRLIKQVAIEGKNAIVCAGRGWGKSVAGRSVVVINAINYQGYRPPEGVSSLYNVISAPTLSQAKKVHWEPIEYLFTQTSLSKLVKNINRSEAIITLRKNLPGIMLAGLNSEGSSRLRGLSIPRLVVDEMQNIPHGVWSAIKPAVDRCNGSILCLGTPDGRGSNFHRFIQEMTSQGWEYFHEPTANNPFIPNIEQVLREAKIGLTPKEYAAEFEASWLDLPGAIFSYLDERHFIKVNKSPEGFDATCLGIDWGDRNPSIVVIGINYRPYPYKYTIIDAWDPNSSTSITFDEVKKKALEFANKYSVHSVMPDVFQPGHQSYILEFSQLPHPGLRNIPLPGSPDYTNMRKLRVMPSAALLDRLLCNDRLFINKDLDFVENQFRAYRRKQTKTGDYLDVPDDNTREHCIDCCRYVIANLEETLRLRYGLSEANYSPFAFAA